VLFFENKLRSGWTINTGDGAGGGGAGYAGYTDSEGNEVVVMSESGTMVDATSTALFEKATEDFDRSLSRMNYVEFLSAVANGLASIEAYIAQKAYQYNVRNPDRPLRDDNKNKVSFEDKVKKWVPQMAGERLNLGGTNWAHFQRLKKARDIEHTHSKSPALHITFRELCKLLNLFRSGIAGMLLNLHALFREKTPSIIVKYAFHPVIKLEYEPEPEIVEEIVYPQSGAEPSDYEGRDVRKVRDYEHHFDSEGTVGSCRLRVYEREDRPVIVATQRSQPQGAALNSVRSAANIIAADLVKEGILAEAEIGDEIREESAKRESVEPIADVAPFVFVEEYLEPERQLAFLWFDSYWITSLMMNGTAQDQIGNSSRQDTNREEVEVLIAASLDE
jgi:hypothetical protein